MYTLNHFTVFLFASIRILFYGRVSLIIDRISLVLLFLLKHQNLQFFTVNFLQVVLPALHCYRFVLSRGFIFFLLFLRCVVWNATKHIVPLLDLDFSFDMCISAFFSDFSTRSSYMVYIALFFFIHHPFNKRIVDQQCLKMYTFCVHYSTQKPTQYIALKDA